MNKNQDLSDYIAFINHYNIFDHFNPTKLKETLSKYNENKECICRNCFNLYDNYRFYISECGCKICHSCKALHNAPRDGYKIGDEGCPVCFKTSVEFYGIPYPQHIKMNLKTMIQEFDDLHKFRKMVTTAFTLFPRKYHTDPPMKWEFREEQERKIKQEEVDWD